MSVARGASCKGARRSVKDDAWVRLPRETWVLGMAYAEKSGRKLREIAAKALTQYIKRQEAKKK